MKTNFFFTALVFATFTGAVGAADYKSQKASPMKIPSVEQSPPCTLSLQEIKKIDNKWKILVKLSLNNKSDKVFLLDAMSFGLSHGLSNDLFIIKSGSNRIQYTGEMVKRAAPKNLIIIQPGSEQVAIIDLGQDYKFPLTGGKFTVQYKFHNHFSPNDVDLESNPITITLKK